MTMAPVAGRLYRYVGPRRMALFGLSLAAAAMLAFVWVDLQTNEWWIRGLMLLRGWGFGLSLTAMQTATFATIGRASMGRGSAISSVIRQVGISLTVAVLATVLSAGMLGHGAVLGDPRTKAAAVFAFHDAFFAATLITLAAAALVLFVDDRLAAVTMRPAAQPLAASPQTDEQGVGVAPLVEGGEA
jgi:MFS family permease